MPKGDVDASEGEATIKQVKLREMLANEDADSVAETVTLMDRVPAVDASVAATPIATGKPVVVDGLVVVTATRKAMMAPDVEASDKVMLVKAMDRVAVMAVRNKAAVDVVADASEIASFGA